MPYNNPVNNLAFLTNKILMGFLFHHCLCSADTFRSSGRFLPSTQISKEDEVNGANELLSTSVLSSESQIKKQEPGLVFCVLSWSDLLLSITLAQNLAFWVTASERVRRFWGNHGLLKVTIGSHHFPWSYHIQVDERVRINVLPGDCKTSSVKLNCTAGRGMGSFSHYKD